MNLEKERANRVKCLSDDILEKLMEDNIAYNPEDLKNVIEMLARSVADLVNIYTGKEEDHATALKGTISKMRISYNILHYKEKAKTLRKRNKYHPVIRKRN
ncbi:hypothetical protein DFO73_11872 [Cytobacillus oceanisediminis]|jgi:hypothetical protein|uniref:Uncharacterized protein n=1 Tax=Cytobacillus oceanisediminis TaxID=665099 RepID=A0A2V2ZJ15_9BACI|nr:hypothetical protein [Cytobacillus oceanisediminis]PWW19878.1 hypothetical protein DFO73_11872 [Cytobacillus oceanisediminis]